MEKNATLNIRVNPAVKKSAEMVLSQLGVPMATAIDMFLKQVVLTGSIPFAIALPKAPANINADTMSEAQIREKLNEGSADIENGKITLNKMRVKAERAGFMTDDEIEAEIAAARAGE